MLLLADLETAVERKDNDAWVEAGKWNTLLADRERLTRLLVETKQSAAAAVERATELLAEREAEVEQLRAALALEKHENTRWEHIADELETRLVAAQRLLREAVTAYECGVWGPCFSRVEANKPRVVKWIEAARTAGGDDE